MRGFNRRSFLKGLGLGGAGLTLGQLGMPSLPSLAGGTAEPFRVIYLIHTQQICLTPARMLPLDAPSGYDELLIDRVDNRTTPFEGGYELDLTARPESEWSPIFAPLYRHRDNVAIFDGLCRAASQADDRPLALHAKGAIGSMTAAPILNDEDNLATQPSMDFRINEHLRQSVDPTMRNLAYTVDWYTSSTREVGDGFLFGQAEDGSIYKQPSEVYPQQAFDALFPGGIPDDSGPDPFFAAQPDVLATVQGEFERLAVNASAEDRAKLEAHRDHIATLEAQLSNPLTCSLPERVEAIGSGPDRQVVYDHHFEAFRDLIVSAFACDLSRVATLQFYYATGSDFFADDQDSHNVHAHRIYDQKYWDEGEAGRAEYEESLPVMEDYNRLYMEYAARLADALDSIPEGGGTMLDNTAIVVVSELGGDGLHYGHDCCAVVLGGSSRFNLGRYTCYPRNAPTPIPWLGWRQYVSPVAYSRIHVAMCQAMGMDLQHFGIESLPGQVQGGSEQSAPYSLVGPPDGLMR